jgi:hypothetical protein
VEGRGTYLRSPDYHPSAGQIGRITSGDKKVFRVLWRQVIRIPVRTNSEDMLRYNVVVRGMARAGRDTLVREAVAPG